MESFDKIIRQHQMITGMRITKDIHTDIGNVIDKNGNILHFGDIASCELYVINLEAWSKLTAGK